MKYLLSHSQCNTQQAERTNERTAASKHWDEVNICLKTRTLNVNTISCHFPCVMPALLFAISNILCSLGFHSSDRHRRYIRVPSFFSFRSLCKSYSKNIFFRLMGKSLFYGSLFFAFYQLFSSEKRNSRTAIKAIPVGSCENLEIVVVAILTFTVLLRIIVSS